MRPKTVFSIGLFIALVFVGFGDSFLPDPLGSASANTRTQINEFIVGLFPYTEPLDNPSKRTEGEIEKMRRGNSGN